MYLRHVIRFAWSDIIGTLYQKGIFIKGKVFLGHTMKARKLSRGVIPLILVLGTGWR